MRAGPAAGGAGYPFGPPGDPYPGGSRSRGRTSSVHRPAPRVADGRYFSRSARIALNFTAAWSADNRSKYATAVVYLSAHPQMAAGRAS